MWYFVFIVILMLVPYILHSFFLFLLLLLLPLLQLMPPLPKRSHSTDKKFFGDFCYFYLLIKYNHCRLSLSSVWNQNCVGCKLQNKCRWVFGCVYSVFSQAPLYPIRWLYTLRVALFDFQVQIQVFAGTCHCFERRRDFHNKLFLYNFFNSFYTTRSLSPSLNLYTSFLFLIWV